jgi:nitrite reductase/ring-hydroxylating ferredoxin subunit
MSGKQPQKSQSREEKRARFSQPGGRRGTKKLTLLVVFGMAALVIYVAFRGSSSSEPVTAAVVQLSQPTPSGVESQSPSEQKAPENPLRSPKAGADAAAAEKEIAVPLTDLKDGHARFFKYTAADNTDLRFFAIRSSDGVYRAALDACDVCYRAKKGYVQDGDDMVCKKCGQRFHSALVNDFTGGCNPVAIARNVVGDKLIIKTSELESRKAFF